MPDHPAQTESTTFPVTEEEVEIHRVQRDTGHALRVRKHVTAQPVDIEADSVLETVTVERVKVGRVVDHAPPMRQEGDVTVVPVVEERAVLVKQLVLVEEIRLTRSREVIPKVAHTTLRKEEVSVEQFDPQSREWKPEADD